MAVMSAVLRGAKNAVRNPGRALAVVLILGLSLGLALSMAMSRAAVDDGIDQVGTAASSRIATIEGSLGNTLQLRPAGANPFGGGGPGGGETMSQANLTAVPTIAHVSKVAELLQRQVPAANTTLVPVAGGFGGRGQTQSLAPCDVPAATTQNGGGRDFAPRVSLIGANDLNVIAGSGLASFTVTQGAALDAKADNPAILLGCVLAKANNLAPGGTVTLYGSALTVAGIYDTGTQGGNRGAIVALATLQRLTASAGLVSQAVVVVDAAPNVNATRTAVQAAVGSDVDVTSQADVAQNVVATIQSADATQQAALSSISSIAQTSMWGALAASGVILLLTMFMIVRERRREIGVLKAIGASGSRVVAQFVSEAVAFAVMASVAAGAIGVLAGNTVAHILVKANSTTGTTGTAPGPGQFNGFGGFGPATLPSPAINTSLDPALLLLGLAVVLAVAVVGSALPSWFISRIRPSEVLRGE